MRAWRHFRSFGVVSMECGLTGAHLELHRQAMQFAAAELRPYAKEWEEKGAMQTDALQKAAKLGFAGILTDTRFGGLGKGRMEASIILEALAYGSLDIAVLMGAQNLCGGVISDRGTDEQKAKWLKPVTEAKLWTAFCLTEPESGSDAGSLNTRADKSGDNFVINGEKAFTTGAGASYLYLVMCKTAPKEISCIMVEKEAKGLTFGKPYATMGWRGHPTCPVYLSDVTVPQSHLIGKLGEGFKGAMKALTGARVNMASMSVGGAALALDKMVEYMSKRKQFGQRLSDLQSLRFRAADCAAELVSARVLVREAARAIDEKRKEAAVMAAMAKRVATETGFKIADVALQMHGGYGNLESFEIERLFRDLRVNRIAEGSSEIMNVLISRDLFPD